MDKSIHISHKIIEILNKAAPWVAIVLLRILIGWEFLESGLEKYYGENWFSQIQAQFLFPFNLIPPSISWAMATWFEIIGGVALIIGLGTRFFSFSLIILTIVAMAAVHWPDQWHTLEDLAKGYAITDRGYGNFKLPLIFLIILTQLTFIGAGKLSLDHLIHKWVLKKTAVKPAETQS